MITQKDKDLIRFVLDCALEAGADKARASLSRSSEDIVSSLNGETDRISSCADCSLALSIFADGRFGSFSTNKLSPEALRGFITESVEITRMLSRDGCRDLPDPARCCTTAITGNELRTCDPAPDTTPAGLGAIAEAASVFNRPLPEGEGYTIISEEGEYSDAVYDLVLGDTNGTLCCHSERNYDYGTEVTIEAGGNIYSAYHWDSTSRGAELMTEGCGRAALAKAIAQIGSQPAPSGKYTMVLDSEVASKMVSPLLNALKGASLQQNNSFLLGSLGKKMFSDKLNIVDRPHIMGQSCSKLFDSEGVVTRDLDIVREGTVQTYFLSTYFARKMEMEPTIEDATRPVVLPTLPGTDAAGLMERCGEGIYVTGFNGGNSNPVSGDFSYGIEGFLFSGGRIVRPVSGMLVTGNFITLWNKLLDIADDARACMSKLIPTLAFENVDFSG